MLEYLRSLESQKIYYCPNPGNAGDSAIALGTYQLFDRAGLSYELVRWDEEFDAEGNILLYGGGGNLGASYPQARTFIERHHERAKKLIVLPHTIQGNEDLLRRLGTDVDIFCREYRSFKWVTTHASGANVYLSDDLAFHLDARDVLERRGVSAQRLVRWIVNWPIQGAVRRYVLPSKAGERVAMRPAFTQGARAILRLMYLRNASHLFALRTDREREGGKLPSGNVDVSQVFAYGTAPHTVALTATGAVLTFLDRFSRISTNRLHVCILAALLGKEVDFYANSYFKNEAVYELSIKNNYPNVRWCGRWEGA